LPRWHNLPPEVRQLLLAGLMRMLQPHLPAPNADAAREVADDSP
jgi:hypothetical protein